MLPSTLSHTHCFVVICPMKKKLSVSSTNFAWPSRSCLATARLQIIFSWTVSEGISFKVCLPTRIDITLGRATKLIPQYRGGGEVG